MVAPTDWWSLTVSRDGQAVSRDSELAWIGVTHVDDEFNRDRPPPRPASITVDHVGGPAVNQQVLADHVTRATHTSACNVHRKLNNVGRRVTCDRRVHRETTSHAVKACHRAALRLQRARPNAHRVTEDTSTSDRQNVVRSSSRRKPADRFTTDD